MDVQTTNLTTFTFTFMHLADAFIQSDLHCIQVTVSTFFFFFFLSALAFPGNRTHDLSVASAMLYQLSYRKAFHDDIMSIWTKISEECFQHLVESMP